MGDGYRQFANPLRKRRRGSWRRPAALTAGAVLAAGLAASTAPALAASGPVQTTLPFTGLIQPWGVAVDAAGNVFVSDYTSNDDVVELPAGATSSSQQKTVPFTGLDNPLGVAVDTAGTLYVTDYYNKRVLSLPAGATSSTQQKTLPFAGLGGPYGVAVDAPGNVYVADQVNNRVVELPAGATSSSQQKTLPFTGLNFPIAVAVDGAGNVYADDLYNNRIVELPAGATSSSQQKTLPFTNINNMDGMGVDAAGDVFVTGQSTDGSGSVVAELPAGATSSSQQVALPFTGLSIDLTGVTTDAAGSVYVDDRDGGDGRALKMSGYEPSTTTITSVSPAAPVAGQAFTVTVSAAGAPSAGGVVFSGKPSGPVTVSDGDGQSCTATLTGGSGSCQLTEAKAGRVKLTASYAGEGAFTGSASSGTEVTVKPAVPPFTTLSNTVRCQVTASLHGTCTLTLKNAGPDTATGVVPWIALAPGLTETSCTPTCSAFDGTQTWDLGTLADGAAVTESVTFTAQQSGTYYVQAGAVSATPGLNTPGTATIAF
jgi:sugar lactone lactonase YvrE